MVAPSVLHAIWHVTCCCNACVLMQEYKCHNADILLKEDCTVDDLIDVIEVQRLLHLVIWAGTLHIACAVSWAQV